MPEWEKLGELYKDKKKVTIAKMNSINNEVPGLPILDVPTLALFIKGSTTPIYYKEDDRTTNAFSQFITTSLKSAAESSAKTKKPASKPKEETKKEEKTEKAEKTKKKGKKSKDEL
ncbi:unnamed protein product [Gongylonema pulchrum]|uniref:Thioredoxin domain-containing protein n=1 Tax=Gongylonema pulchrum TaxID=637853 RepID=A0A183E4I8_9BILA|nr:unnamed protein product [Gongylonema pulchrum]